MGVDATPSTEPTIPSGKKIQRQIFWPPFISRLYIYIYMQPIDSLESQHFLPSFLSGIILSSGERAWIWALWTRWFLMKCNEAWQRCLGALVVPGSGRVFGGVRWEAWEISKKNNKKTTKKQTISIMGVCPPQNCCTTWGVFFFGWSLFSLKCVFFLSGLACFRKMSRCFFSIFIQLQLEVF